VGLPAEATPLQRLAPHVPPVQFDQVKGVESDLLIEGAGMDAPGKDFAIAQGPPVWLEAIDVLACYLPEVSGRAGDSKLFSMSLLKFLKGYSCGQAECLDFVSW